MKVHLRHVRSERLCLSGVRSFWKSHGWDWADFLANGIDAETLEATGDARALRVVEVARGEK